MRKILLLVCLMLFALWTVQAQTVSVTFQVDMKVQIVKGAFNPASHQASARGAFNDWSETAMTDDDTDSVYTVTVAGFAQNSTENAYKFYHSGGGEGGTWEDGDNKNFAVGTSDTTLPVRFFNDEAMPSGEPAAVTFEVDMRLPAKQDANFLARTVYVAGTFTDWGTGALEMEDADGDTVYSVVDTIPSGQLLQYKFLHTATDVNGATWEDGDNRTHWVVDGDQTVHRFFNDVDPNVTLANGNIFFEVDMRVATELGVFNPATDSVQIRGGFNGWGDSDPPRSLMNQDPGNENAWFLDIPFVLQEVNGSQLYKFFIKKAVGEYSNTGWEVPIGNTVTTDRNREILFEGSDTQEASRMFFENIHTEWVIPQGTSVEATFTVDMKPAMPGFNPAADTVWWIPRQPLYYAINNLEWSLEQRVLQLTDADNDSNYTGTLTIDGPAFNGFLYNYAYTSGTGFVQEDGGQGGARVRFIGQSGGARSFDSPWTMPQDIWTDGEKEEETAPQGWVTGVEVDRLGPPSSYTLEQNYPNPFNPSTVIQFNLSTKELVLLKVFNLLGQEVATVVNEELIPGSYKVTFDAKGLATGMYVYRITAGSFVQSRSMLLLK